jgi:hypothetical protein
MSRRVSVGRYFLQWGALVTWGVEQRVVYQRVPVTCHRPHGMRVVSRSLSSALASNQDSTKNSERPEHSFFSSASHERKRLMKKVKSSRQLEVVLYQRHSAQRR